MIDENNQPDVPKWAGWLKCGRGAPWQRICESDSWHVCMALLTQEARKRRHGNCQTRVVEGGRDLEREERELTLREFRRHHPIAGAHADGSGF